MSVTCPSTSGKLGMTTDVLPQCRFIPRSSPTLPRVCWRPPPSPSSRHCAGIARERGPGRRSSAGGLVFLARDAYFTKDLVSLLPWGLGMLFSHLLDLRCLCKYANDVNGQETKQQQARCMVNGKTRENLELTFQITNEITEKGIPFVRQNPGQQNPLILSSYIGNLFNIVLQLATKYFDFLYNLRFSQLYTNVFSFYLFFFSKTPHMKTQRFCWCVLQQ